MQCFSRFNSFIRVFASYEATYIYSFYFLTASSPANKKITVVYVAALCAHVNVYIRINLHMISKKTLQSIYWQNKANTQSAVIARNQKRKKEKRKQIVCSRRIHHFSAREAERFETHFWILILRAHVHAVDVSLRVCSVCTSGRWLRVCNWWEMRNEWRV